MKSSPVRDHVLVAEDNVVVRRLVVAQLRKAGFAVREAKDGVEALEVFSREPTPVVVTDLGMPRLGGMELLAALRRVDPPPEVIVLTGTHAQDARAAVQALRLGAHDYIVKDAEAAGAIPHAVARALEKWRLREENTRLLGELRRLSLTDSLTGLGNRRSFDEALRQEVARFRRNESPLALVLLDLDHFKKVNDSLGHRVGDEVLISFAARLRSVARESDRLFRYGGEEFAVLAVDSDEDGAVSLAWRVVRATASRTFSAGHRRVEVSCSAGVAITLSGDDTAGESFVGRADAALYQAKRQGRNRACTAPAPVVAVHARAALAFTEESC
jgi:diguanylate cyclase (GGDEF)-like protein